MEIQDLTSGETFLFTQSMVGWDQMTRVSCNKEKHELLPQISFLHALQLWSSICFEKSMSHFSGTSAAIFLSPMSFVVKLQAFSSNICHVLDIE